VGVVANSRWNLAAFGFNLAAQFLTVPFVIDQIGLAAFGLSGLVLAVCAPFALVGTVLGQALTREMADAWAQDDARGAGRLANTAAWLCTAFCILGCPLLILLGPMVLEVLAHSQQDSQEAWLLFAAAALGWAAQQFGFVFQGAAAARQQYALIARASAWSALLTVLAILAITAAHPTPAGYLLAVSVGFTASALMVILAVSGPSGVVRLTMRPDRGAARRLLGFGKWQAVSQLAGTLGNQIDRYLLGALAPVSVVGQYNAANRLQEAAYAGVMKGSEVLFPRFGAMGASTVSERAQYFLLASWVVMVFSAAVLAPLIPLADALLTLWVGPEVADGGAIIMKTLVLGGLIGAGTNVFTYYTLGSGRPAQIARISLAYAAVTIVASLLLLTLLGPMAAGAGLVVASVFRLAASLLLAHRGLFAGSGLSALLQSTLVPMSIGTGLAYGLLLVNLPAVNSWGQVAGQYTAIAGAVVVLCTGSLGVSKVGRKLFADLLCAGRPSHPPGA
jgi:O-antigen/teichoic acid export membrane protein